MPRSFLTSPGTIPVQQRRFGNNLLDAALSLAETPYKGSPHQKLAGIRKLTLRPIKIFYRVNEPRRVVEILRFWHSARTEPKL